MRESVLELFGLFGLDLSSSYIEQLTMAQLIPMFLVASMAFCVIGGVLRGIFSMARVAINPRIGG